MNGYSRLVVAGNLTRDPELRHTGTGKAVASFTVAVNSAREADNTVFMDCQAWEKTAENVAKYVKKGDPVLVDGRLRQEEWTTKEGQKRSKIVCRADSVLFLSAGRSTAEHGETAQGSTGGGRGVHSGVRGPSDAQDGPSDGAAGADEPF